MSIADMDMYRTIVISPVKPAKSVPVAGADMLQTMATLSWSFYDDGS